MFTMCRVTKNSQYILAKYNLTDWVTQGNTCKPFTHKSTNVSCNIKLTHTHTRVCFVVHGHALASVLEIPVFTAVNTLN